MRPSDRNGWNRRDFLKQTALTAGIAGTGWLPGLTAAAASRAKGVAIIADPDDPGATAPPVRWAIGQLQQALADRGVSARLGAQINQAASEEICVVAAGPTAAPATELLREQGLTLPDAPEATALAAGTINKRSVVLACGRDARGLVYALLELADRVVHEEKPLAAFAITRPITEQPANRIRSIARCFVSDVEDKPWFNDRAFWRRYLTLLAAQRFNRFSLTLGIGYDFATNIRDCYFHFAYPFLVSPPGHSVRAVPLPDAERDRNLEMLRFISDETAARGLHFQLGLWTHAYQWTNSPNANYTIEGLTAATHAAYCRDALLLLLTACPAISGVTFRIHGESGVAEGNYDFWKTVFDGLVKCGRRVEIDMHAKGMDQAMIDVALATGLPVNVSPKFWAEHMGLPYMQGAIRPMEMPPREVRDQGFFSKSGGSRRFLRYGYGDLLAEDRRHGVLHRIWPGTQRLLLWGNPNLAAEYGRASSLCGSAGVELCEPLSFKGRKGSGLAGGRNAYADASLRPAGGDFEKFLYTYRVWGRRIYNPDCDPEVWRRFLRRQFGAGAQAMGETLAVCTRILPLVTTAHCPSAANNNYWPEMYTNMPIVDAKKPHPYGDTPSPKRFGTVSSLDPEFFSRIDDFADELLRGETSARYSPADVAEWLHNMATRAADCLAEARSQVADVRGAEFRRWEVDAAIQVGLGRFFAEKFRAGTLYALYERTGHRPALAEALKAYRQARAAWAELAERAKDVYARDITFGYDKHLRGHWLDRLPGIDQDIADMEALLEKAPAGSTASAKVETKVVEQAIRSVLKGSTRAPAFTIIHKRPDSFARGKPLAITVSLPKGRRRPLLASVRLHYRRLNQAEVWQVAETAGGESGYQAVIPADCTDSPFPLQYYFELRERSGAAWLHPGLKQLSSLAQPYFVVRQAK